MRREVSSLVCIRPSSVAMLFVAALGRTLAAQESPAQLVPQGHVVLAGSLASPVSGGAVRWAALGAVDPTTGDREILARVKVAQDGRFALSAQLSGAVPPLSQLYFEAGGGGLAPTTLLGLPRWPGYYDLGEIDGRICARVEVECLGDVSSKGAALRVCWDTSVSGSEREWIPLTPKATLLAASFGPHRILVGDDAGWIEQYDITVQRPVQRVEIARATSKNGAQLKLLDALSTSPALGGFTVTLDLHRRKSDAGLLPSSIQRECTARDMYFPVLRPDVTVASCRVTSSNYDRCDVPIEQLVDRDPAVLVSPLEGRHIVINGAEAGEESVVVQVLEPEPVAGLNWGSPTIAVQLSPSSERVTAESKTRWEVRLPERIWTSLAGGQIRAYSNRGREFRSAIASQWPLHEISCEPVLPARLVAVTGTVWQSSGSALSNVWVQVRLDGQSPVLVHKTDLTGRFSFLATPGVEYSIQINDFLWRSADLYRGTLIPLDSTEFEVSVSPQRQVRVRTTSTLDPSRQYAVMLFGSDGLPHRPSLRGSTIVCQSSFEPYLALPELWDSLGFVKLVCLPSDGMTNFSDVCDWAWKCHGVVSQFALSRTVGVVDVWL